MSSCVSQLSPWVPRKSSARGSGTYRHTPFDQFVRRADCKANANHDKEHPSAPLYDPAPNEYFARDHCGHKSLRKMPDAIVVVPAEVPVIANPAEYRLAGVSIMSANAEDDGLRTDQG